MSLSLKVQLPQGCDEKVKTFKFSGNQCPTVKEAVATIAADQRLPDPDLWTLYLPAGKDCASQWYSPSAQLSTVNAKNQLELRHNHILIRTTFFNGSEFILKSIGYPLFKPIGQWLPYVAYKFGLDSADGYALKIIGKQEELAFDKQLVDQAGFQDGNCRFLFFDLGAHLDMTSMKIFHDIQEHQYHRGTKEKSEFEVSFNFDEPPSDVDLEAAASQLLMNMPKVSGSLSIVEKKKKKLERMFCILIANHLFFYKSQNDPKPTRVLNLAHYTAAGVEDKKKKVAWGYIELTSDNKKEEVIVLKADTDRWQKIWLNDNLIKACEEARVEQEQKKQQQQQSDRPKVFCTPLELQVSVADGSELPKIVPKCIEYIEERALMVEGIFRLSGSAVLIQEYKQRFDNGEDVSFENESDPHAVAGLFKLYFRELPEPVMTWNHYDDFIIAESIANPSLRLRYLRYLIDNKLPAISRSLLRTLVSFLRKVNEHSAVNKMPIHNIATVFGPNLLRQKNANMIQMVEDTAQINNIVNLLINYDGYLLNGRPLPEDIDEDDLAGVYAKALYDYNGENPNDDLSFKKNDIIQVIIVGVDGWSKGELNGKFGKFPGAYTQILQGEELKKNMRRVRFKQEMVRLRQQNIDEDKTMQRLEQEKSELLAVHSELASQWDALERVFSVLADRLVQASEKQKCELFGAKLKEVLDRFLAYNLVHDDIADSRFELVNELNTLKTECLAEPKDKKKKIDKKVQDNLRKLLEPITEQFAEQQALHKKNIRLDAEVVQTLQALDQVAYFLHRP